MMRNGSLFSRVMAAMLFVALMFVSCSEEAPVISPLAQQLGFSKDRPLVMGMNTSYAPLQYVNDQGEPSGYDVAFTKILMKRLGIPFTFSPNHWDKMSPGIIGGKYDMGMLVYSPYRKEITNYSNAVFRLYYQVVYREKDFSDFDFRHLKGKRIAYMKSRPIGLMLKDEGADGYPITDLSEAFVELADGKYDGLICYRFQAKYNIAQLHLGSKLQTEELSLEPREYCYASHDKRLIDAIDKELKKMEEEGIIDEVYGQEVAERFGAIKIPMWVWGLLAGLCFVFLLVFSINRYRYSKRLKQAHNQLQKAYDELKTKNSALQIANARAEESTRMKSNFIKQISHEIRTPLNVVSGFTQVLASDDAGLTKDQKKDISIQIMENTDRITGLVNKMLELSDIKSNAVLERDDQASALIIAEQAVKTSGIEKAAHLVFELIQQQGADVLFNTHLRSAVHALLQLLSNAIKFTHPAEAMMAQVKTKQEKATLTIGLDEGKVTFIVENTGKQIPAGEAEHIFDEFVQLDEYYDGTGIGLAVARSLARRLGGDVRLDTSYTEGARFVMTLSVA
ncbi:MAG: transporter substrate-binding domain-containing protein [Prevotella sp.]|nr:transporter substrate-binding domain-containing protein [Prevotella sp.]